ncbi:type II secretion system protein [Ideonella paludis]|uniref:Type II secretion system protein n=1 Tax=Ideonella paludis TaxID=1233411 RepID=A0ABS5DVD4_9BURK|nr:type II secretion system protein [Ideonella paludis]MBQ0935105.1 type II secretion system protein [Ideonella paludis]
MKVSGRGRSATQRGLTLVELLVVMAVLGILAWAATPMVELSVQRQREQELKRALWEIRDALDAYHLAAQQGLVAGGASGYPPSLEALVQGVPDVKAPGQMRYFLRRIPSDPFAPPSTPAALSWGLRAYDTPPDRPGPGADVYDVYSRSNRMGLNGQPVSQW